MSLKRTDVREVINKQWPLGPPYTEALFNRSPAVFRQLYDETNHVHRSARAENHSYIIGRKGAGKTAFLIGCAHAEHAEVVLVRSEDIFTEVNKLRIKYAAANGSLVADSLVHVWEVLLYHAAMWQIARSDRLPDSDAQQRVWSYMCSFGDPFEMEADHLLAAVSAHMSKALLAAPEDLSFREICWSIRAERGAFADAAKHARAILESAGRSSICVVVDNLEDLHKHLDEFSDVVTALFRVTTRDHIGTQSQRLPFMSRFAFPAELLPRLQVLSANAEKDFQERLTIRWTASELIVVVGNRLRTFLDLYYPRAPETLGLPRRHDPADRRAAESTLRAVLPEKVTNGYGSTEDPIAYLLRHTQLLPRHLIQILNEIVGRATKHLERDAVPRATAQDVTAGVRAAELTIVKGILTTYSYAHPHVGEAMAAIKNHAHVVESVSELHRIFNEASVSRVGIDFEEFLDACLSIGALGVVIGDTPRYVDGEFSYTFMDDVRAVEDRDRLCVHPLFMYQWFDRRAIAEMAKAGVKPVYPYGSDPAHEDLDV
jgi:hypothetical protein